MKLDLDEKDEELALKNNKIVTHRLNLSLDKRNYLIILGQILQNQTHYPAIGGEWIRLFVCS